jgi:hypothetical protein
MNEDYSEFCSHIVVHSWHFAQSLSEKRSKGKYKNNIFVYRFSQPTHIPGYKECWGKVSSLFISSLLKAMNALH